ncbi:MAG: hypothetical protein ACE5F9_09455 [Phycisphaerae bacterium]
MKTRAIFLGVSFLAGLIGTRASRAEQTPASAPTVTLDIAEGCRLLESVQDNVYSFDDPAFYWFCRYAAVEPEPFVLTDADRPLPWQFLLERPRDYRGRMIVVEGTLRRRLEFRVPDRFGDRPLYQSELSGRNTRGFCTVVTTTDPANVPLRSRVRVKGCFIKVRAYRTSDGTVGAGPLLVARELEATDAATSGFRRDSGGGWPVRPLVAGTVLLAVAWLLVRRRVGRSLRPESRHAGPGSIAARSDHDFDWLLDGDDKP